MNVLFLSLGKYNSIKEPGIYTDLLREFVKNGFEVFVVSPIERRDSGKTHIIKEDKCTILRVKTGNIQKTKVIEKGINTLLIEPQFLRAIKRYFGKVHFDLILYPTPPITFVKVVKYLKKRDKAMTYLLLKDIFPQNAVDIGLLSTSGIRGIIYRYFRRQEKELYRISDYIGCMSPANVDYLIKHNSFVDKNTVEVCPNSIEVIDKSIDEKTRKQIRETYGIPLDKKVFVYGGNLGKPQGIPFFIECMKRCRDIKEAFFLVVGNGTEYSLLDKYVTSSRQENLKVLKTLPKKVYSNLVAACDVGMIFLDYRFTIPNFPSRMLGYMQAKLPILTCTDINSDIGDVVEKGGFGWWCNSNDSNEFKETINKIVIDDCINKGELSYEYLQENYSVHKTYSIINSHLNAL